MFKNSFVSNLVKSSDFPRGADNQSSDDQFDYCVSEAFRGDLSTGSIVLGERTSAAHGLNTRSSGLLAITRVYSTHDRMRVLNIFEEACMRSTRFSFHTTILSDSGADIPILCTGETLVSTDGKSGLIKGVFVFSRNSPN